MSRRKSAQPILYVYANPGSPKEQVSYYSCSDGVVTAGSLNSFNFRKNLSQTEIIVQCLQHHLDAEYDLIFDIDPTIGTSSPLNPKIRSYLESKLRKSK